MHLIVTSVLEDLLNTCYVDMNLSTVEPKEKWSFLKQSFPAHTTAVFFLSGWAQITRDHIPIGFGSTTKRLHSFF